MKEKLIRSDLGVPQLEDALENCHVDEGAV